MPRRGEQIRTTWAEAPELIRSRAESLRASRGHGLPVVVGITGPAGSGKSTLAARIGGPALSTDQYLPDHGGLPETKRDEPRHAALSLLAEHLDALRRGHGVDAPRWSFHTHRREGILRVEPGAVLVCEGLFALREEVLRLLDLAVYVDAPADLRRLRWEAIERSGGRGWGVRRARRYLELVADPTFERHAHGYRTAADVIVVNDGMEGRGAEPVEWRLDR